MIDKLDKLTPVQIWQTALGEIQLQLTSATFNTWLGRTQLVSFEDGVFTIGVHNSYAQDWLENRLDSMIRRTLTGICGRAVQVRFVVTLNEPHPEPAAAIAPIFEMPAAPPREMPDLKEVGYFPVTRYENEFWAVSLGVVGFRIWQIVRADDIRREKSEWTPEAQYSVPYLARRVKCGPQQITGIPSRNRPGAFAVMQRRGIATVRRHGGARDPHTRYIIAVRVRLPLLTPDQVIELPDELQTSHNRWLADYGFDPRDWFLSSDDSHD